MNKFETNELDIPDILERILWVEILLEINWYHVIFSISSICHGFDVGMKLQKIAVIAIQLYQGF